MNLREVDAEHGVERATGIDSGCIGLSGLVTGGPKRFGRRSTGLLQLFERTFDLLVTCSNLCLVDFIELEGLRQREQVLFTVVPNQGLADCLHRRMTSDVPI